MFSVFKMVEKQTDNTAIFCFSGIVERLNEIIVHLVIQAPNLAQMMSRMYFLRKVRWPPKIQDGRHFSRWTPRQMQKRRLFEVELELTEMC